MLQKAAIVEVLFLIKPPVEASLITTGSYAAPKPRALYIPGAKVVERHSAFTISISSSLPLLPDPPIPF